MKRGDLRKDLISFQALILYLIAVHASDVTIHRRFE